MSQDNKSVIMMGNEYTSMKKSKHLLTKLTYIKNMQENSVIKIVYLSTDNMTADVLTKPLHGFFFTKHVRNMMGLKWSGKFHEQDKKKVTNVTTGEVVGGKRSQGQPSIARRAAKRQKLKR